jgi:ubiquinone/menaquinone biosynthesis C-methylase UbiE
LYDAPVALQPLAEQFASVADAYERGRPDYAPAVVGAIAAELHIPPGAPILDLAAGTGKLKRALLAAGFDVTAVEPQHSLREVLAANVGAERALDEVAEAVPLPDASVEAVTVADAFHWFEPVAALAEIRRVLRPPAAWRCLQWFPTGAEPRGRTSSARTETLARVRALVAAGETPDELSVQVVVGLASLA